MTFKRVSGPALAALLFLVAMDQITKWLVVENLEPRTAYPVIGDFFRLYLIRNPGAAFSMGVDATLVFSMFQIAATIICVVALFRVRSWWSATPAILIGAGAAGNLIDRIFRSPGGLHGQVVDFLSFGDFAIFNIADSCITVGVFLYVIYTLFIEPRRQEDSTDTERPKKEETHAQEDSLR